MNNHNLNFNQLSACQVGSDVLSPVPKLGRRIILTQEEIDQHIGNLKDIHSKKNKSIKQLKSTYGFYKPILDDLCRKSNGGLISFPINQKAIRGTKLNNKVISAQALSNIISNLLHHNIIKKVQSYQVGVVASTYEFTDIIKNIFDPVKINIDFRNKAREKTKQELIDHGFNPDDIINCPVCATSKYATSFGIYKDKENPSLIYPKPCCKECEWKYSKKENKPTVFKVSWSNFMNQVKQQKVEILYAEPEKDILLEMMTLVENEK